MTPHKPVFLYRPDGRIDYPAMRNAATRGTKSSRTIAAEKARAEHEARIARQAGALLAQVQTAFRPPAGRLWTVDAEAQIIVGPVGGIGSTPVIVRTLEALATPNRHDEAVVAAAGSLRDVDHLREVLDALAPKLHAIGLRIDRRATGIRVTKPRTKP